MRNKLNVKNLEQSLVKAMPDVVTYSIFAFLLGAFLENLMPELKNQQKISLIFEILAQLFVVVFSFVIASNIYSSKVGLIVFLVVIIGTTPTFFKKIDRLSKKMFNCASSSSNSNNQFEDDIQIYSTKTKERDNKDGKNRPLNKEIELAENDIDYDEENYEESGENGENGEDGEEEDDVIEPIGSTSIRNLKF